MRNLFGLLLLLVVAFTSCEGRKTKHQALKESIQNFKKNIPFEIVEYIPENYHETVTDTLMSNGFNVKIKTFTDLGNHIPIKIEKDLKTKTEFYREVKSEISIIVDDRQVLNTVIDKDFIFSYFKENEHAMTYSNLQGVWINQTNFTNSQSLSLDIYYAEVNSDKREIFQMIINRDGSFRITKNKKENYL
ncbi:hypothetical protein [Winogradskyella ursingii]|uniref:hypothetical protein n=1 Tax=Winogradskyella ursingii TaxID=2686079 RepID=UPI0015CCF1D2|nr:hypothetical protein [Winogradskyella ursingii]